MKNSDIKPLSAGDGIGYYYTKQEAGMFGGGHLDLVAINELGEVTQTGIAAKWDDAALTEHEAVVEHLASGLSAAEADLERRRREAPEPEEKPPPMDPATRRFLSD